MQYDVLKHAWMLKIIFITYVVFILVRGLNRHFIHVGPFPGIVVSLSLSLSILCLALTIQEPV